uniref:Phenol hydroxylase n=1 Tax=Steinernema glaseri TaxID=37863 RepID=A0A1I8ACY5_9BILA
GMAALRLDAADGEHEAARRVHPVGAQGQHAGDVERADDLAGGADAHLVAQVQAHQGVVHEHQALAHGHADVVAEFAWRSAGAPFLAVDHDEVGHDLGGQHGLGDAHELPGVAQAELEAHRFAAGQLAQLRHELEQPHRRAEGAVGGGRDAVFAGRYTARGGDLGAHLVPRQDAAVAGLGALAELDLDHLHLRVAGLFGEALR